jgi:hypothetical protein
MIEVVATPGGDPSLRVDRRYVHSRRDPRSEARRFLDSQKKSEFHPTVLVVGAGLGYLIEEAHRAFPGCRVIALYLSETCRANSGARAEESWDPSCPTDAGAFLLNVLEEDELPGLLSLFWRPALSAFPDAAHEVETRVRQALNRLQASLATTGYFGPRWFRNALANYLNTDEWCRLNRTNLPVVVAAPGPTLSLVIPALREARERFVLIAAASALLPLERAGVTPDLVVHQDAGFYSGEHLRHRAAEPHGESASGPGAVDRGLVDRGMVNRAASDRGMVNRAASDRGTVDGGSAGAGIVMVQPLSARPVPGVPASVAWMSYDHPADALLREHEDSPFLALGQLGTVTATATRLALNLTTGTVYLAGVDMAARDLRSHARGHSFEAYHLDRTERLHPILTTYLGGTIARESGNNPGVNGWRVSADLDIYAGWFARLSEEINGPGSESNPPASAPDASGMGAAADRGAAAYGGASSHGGAPAQGGGRLRRLEPSPVDMGIPIATLSELTALAPPEDGGYGRSEPAGVAQQVTPPPKRERLRRLADAIQAWRRAVEESIPGLTGGERTRGRVMTLPRQVRNLAWHLALPELLRIDRLERSAPRADSTHPETPGPARGAETADAIDALRQRLLSTLDRIEALLRTHADGQAETDGRARADGRARTYGSAQADGSARGARHAHTDGSAETRRRSPGSDWK